jgi:UDP-GlcNAc:undecaprenyl-phosphate GlcNAc-1-phosphate transferase
LIPILALGLPILDTGMSVLRRFMAGKPLFAADRGHIHHKLLDLGLSQKQVVLTLYGLCILMGVGAFSMVYADSRSAAIVLGSITAIVISFSRILGYFRWKTVSTTVQYGLMRQQRLRQHLNSLEKAALSMDSASGPEEVYRILTQVGLEVGLDIIQVDATVKLPDHSEEMDVYWCRELDVDRSGQTMHQIGYSLDWGMDQISIEGHISYAWYCNEEVLQVPERVCYELLATKTRDCLLGLARRGISIQFEEDGAFVA